MRDLEKEIVEGAIEILRSNSERLAALGFAWCEPEIVLPRYESERYSSRISIRFLGDETTEYFFESVFLDGRTNCTKDEILERLKRQLNEVGKSKKWKSLNDLLLEKFPNLREVYEDRLAEWCRPDETPGSYLVYEDVFWHYLASLLRGSNEAELKKAFEFTEALTAHEEEYFQEVAVVTLLEHLCDDDDLLKLAQPYLGSVSRQFTADISASY